MTNYADIEKASALAAEQTCLIDAIGILDHGGTLSTFIVVPLPPTGDLSAMPMEEAIPQLPVAITTTSPPLALLNEARAAMVRRYNDIVTELEALGVTGAPRTSF